MNAVLERELLESQSEGPAEHRPFARDVLAGLALPRKSIPAMWLHDETGAALHEALVAHAHAATARAEVEILARRAGDIARMAGPRATVIELGCGAGRTTPLLLEALDRPAACLPVDASAASLARVAAMLRDRFLLLPVEPVQADFTQLVALPLLAHRGAGRQVVLCSGTTMNQFAPEAVVALLDRIGPFVAKGALMLVGTDTSRDPAILRATHDDADGLNAAFHLNLLARIGRELDGDVSPTAFRHEARIDAATGRVEVHLVSQYTQQATVLGRRFGFAIGESIRTMTSTPYGAIDFTLLAARAGWVHRQAWPDERRRYAVHVLERG